MQDFISWRYCSKNSPRQAPGDFNCSSTDFDGLVQDCSNSSASAMELLQSCTKPSIYGMEK